MPATVSSNGVDTTNGSSLANDRQKDEKEARPRYTSTSYPSNCLRFLQCVSPSHSDGQSVLEKDVKQAKINLDIIIVGAGLGGLATAVALRRRGHDVTVFEQAPELMEVSHRDSFSGFFLSVEAHL